MVNYIVEKIMLNAEVTNEELKHFILKPENTPKGKVFSNVAKKLLNERGNYVQGLY